MPAPAGGGWSEPSQTEQQPNYVIYRPSRTPSGAPAEPSAPSNGTGGRVRAEARRDL
jgi:hypothetical protein